MSTINMSEFDYLQGQREVLADRIADTATRLLIEYIDVNYPDATHIVCDDAELFPVAIHRDEVEIAEYHADILYDEELWSLVGNIDRSLVRYRNLPSPDQFPRGETRIVITEVKEFLS